MITFPIKLFFCRVWGKNEGLLFDQLDKNTKKGWARVYHSTYFMSYFWIRKKKKTRNNH